MSFSKKNTIFYEIFTQNVKNGTILLAFDSYETIC